MYLQLSHLTHCNGIVSECVNLHPVCVYVRMCVPPSRAKGTSESHAAVGCDANPLVTAS